MEQSQQEQGQLTFGKDAVGLSFNPSGNEKVNRLKELLAEAIDIVKEDGPVDEFGVKLHDDAVSQLVLAQMSAVKAVTWHK